MELFAWAGFEPKSSWSLPPEYLGSQAWATGAWPTFYKLFHSYYSSLWKNFIEQIFLLCKFGHQYLSYGFTVLYRNHFIQFWLFLISHVLLNDSNMFWELGCYMILSLCEHNKGYIHKLRGPWCHWERKSWDGVIHTCHC
jgi:hypothetical protein